MEFPDRTGLRFQFDAAADDYHVARPGYPDVLMEALILRARLDATSRCLEVGAGTGQATRALARTGCAIDALEPGPDACRVLTRTLDSHNVTVHTTTLEAFAFEPGTFDALVSATAYHWVDPDRRWTLAASALKPGGVLALLTHAQPEQSPHDDFFDVVNDIYLELEPAMAHTPGSGTLGASRQLRGGMQTSGLFDVEHDHAVDWYRRLSSTDYLTLLRTFSNHLQLPVDRRTALHERIGRLIEERYGGTIHQPYHTVLTMGTRR